MANFTGNPTTTTSTPGGGSAWSSSLLINYVTAEIQTLEPNLAFANFGVKRDVPKGYHTLTSSGFGLINL